MKNKSFKLLLSESEKKTLIKKILEGVEYLHMNKIIHQDLKPNNIIMSVDKKKVKIIDFGISTRLNETMI